MSAEALSTRSGIFSELDASPKKKRIVVGLLAGLAEELLEPDTMSKAEARRTIRNAVSAPAKRASVWQPKAVV